ncbi:hypothetical protein CRM82_10885 [Comamonas terrigena]|uniref:Uncharacterized protein n=1 Tax=Comamonas terrigena TaxID=32013 RepID=A0A2A7UUV6_COMTR|nr:hypothetical protein [Comamonas terrigena]PEH89027.1 hypothetical protein CRM82_10885 [Comamonas terrigena]
MSPHEEGEHFRDEVLVAREDHSVVCIGIKLSLALGRRLAGLYGVPLGQGTGRIRHTQRCVLRAARAHGTVAAHTPTRPHAHTPTRPHAHTPTRPHAHTPAAWQAVAARGGGEQDQACGW